MFGREKPEIRKRSIPRKAAGLVYAGARECCRVPAYLTEKAVSTLAIVAAGATVLHNGNVIERIGNGYRDAYGLVEKVIEDKGIKINLSTENISLDDAQRALGFVNEVGHNILDTPLTALYSVGGAYLIGKAAPFVSSRYRARRRNKRYKRNADRKAMEKAESKYAPKPA